MNKIDDAISHLHIMHTWASFAKENNFMSPIFDEKCCESIERWTNEIIAILKGEEMKPNKEDVIKAIEHCMTEDCTNCPYDGICSTRTHALDNDILELLKDED